MARFGGVTATTCRWNREDTRRSAACSGRLARKHQRLDTCSRDFHSLQHYNMLKERCVHGHRHCIRSGDNRHPRSLILVGYGQTTSVNGSAIAF